ncbi:MAG: hypothetical protein JWP83_4450, partial [Mycobacterium sp.]|nr:hypothetical protein [Mycobacterium sp.]
RLLDEWALDDCARSQDGPMLRSITAPKFRSVTKQFGEVRQTVAEYNPKRWRRNAARRSGIAMRLNKANGTYSAA